MKIVYIDDNGVRWVREDAREKDDALARLVARLIFTCVITVTFFVCLTCLFIFGGK